MLCVVIVGYLVTAGLFLLIVLRGLSFFVLYDFAV